MNTSERRAGTILIVGSYDHDSGAATALAGIQSLVDNESAQVHGATVVRRHHDGKISVDGGPEESGKAPVGWGALAGVTVGILFPPSLLAGALVGGGVGLGVRSKRNRRTKQLSDAIAEHAATRVIRRDRDRSDRPDRCARPRAPRQRAGYQERGRRLAGGRAARPCRSEPGARRGLTGRLECGDRCG